MKTTLLITTYNRADLLLPSLRRLAGLTVPDEVLVIDDGGTDGTEGVCLRMMDYLPLRYVYHYNPGRTICSFARNVGLKLAEGDAIITAEPEMWFQTDVIEQFVRLHQAWPEFVHSAGTIVHIGAEGEAETKVGWVATFVAFYMKDWLMEIGGWDEQFPGAWGHDDSDVVTRLRLNGHPQNIDQQVVARHQYHPVEPDNLEQGTANERYMMAKAHSTDETDHRDLIANEGNEWGVLHTLSS